jgi:hypothetical protein
MAAPTPAELLDAFKAHAKIEHDRHDELIEGTYLPAAIDKVNRTTDLLDADWLTGVPLATVFRIAAAMYEAREVNIDIQPTNAELIAMWRPWA